MTDQPTAISKLGTRLKDIVLSDSKAYASVFGPDKIEQRFAINEEICFKAWKPGEYWLTARKPPGFILISHQPFFLSEGETYRAKPLKQWKVIESS